MERTLNNSTTEIRDSNWDEESEALAHFTPRQELAIMLRLLHAEGFDDHVFGHITLDLDNDTFLTNPNEIGWDQVRASDLLLVDRRSRRLQGSGTPHEGLAIHFSLRSHAVPGTAKVVIHNHPHYATLWAARKQIPPIYDQGGALESRELLLLEDYGTNAEIGRRHGKVLADAGWFLLAHHGVVITGSSIAEAYFRAVVLEMRCRRAWEIEAMHGQAAAPMPAEFVRQAGLIAASGPDYWKFWWNFGKRRQMRKDRTVLN